MNSFVTGSISFLLIISTVITLELMVESIHGNIHLMKPTSFFLLLYLSLSPLEWAKFTAWESIVVFMKNELMVVGSMAFILKCVVFSISIDADWLHAIEFADLVIPITAFVFVLHGKYHVPSYSYFFEGLFRFEQLFTLHASIMPCTLGLILVVYGAWENKHILAIYKDINEGGKRKSRFGAK